MGPVTTNEEISSSNVKGISLPKLAEDSSNWVLYQEHLENTVTASRGLRRHFTELRENQNP